MIMMLSCNLYFRAMAERIVCTIIDELKDQKKTNHVLLRGQTAVKSKS